MATEATSLVSDGRTDRNNNFSQCTWLKKRCGIQIYPRGAYILLVYLGLVFCVLFTCTGTDSPVINKAIFFQVNLSNIYHIRHLILLFFPFLGLIGTKFSRFKVVNFGIVLIIIGRPLLYLMQFIAHAYALSSQILTILSLSAYCILSSGIGLFITNTVQFGLDQLMFEPSQKLQSYLYLQAGVAYLSHMLVCSLLIIVTLFSDWSLSIIATLLALSFPLIVFLLLMCYCKKYIHIEPPPQVNPVKHIYKVMKYAWVNKYPARRSAYTYTERPSRLDLCKERYGGPFTTDEVEEVKSFWGILLVLISMFGAYSLDTPSAIAYFYYNNNNRSYSSNLHESLSYVPVMYPSFFTVSSTFLCILIMRLICVPFLSQYLPRLLTRMGMGLFLALCTSCSLTLHVVWLDKVSFLLVIIPQVLYGCSDFFIFITTMEFIVAQSPLKMQGVLTGLWFCQFYYRYAFYDLSLYMEAYLWQYYITKTVVIFLSCLSFLIVAARYKYRERNEITDVNERLIIAEYTERQLLSRDMDQNESVQFVH